MESIERDQEKTEVSVHFALEITGLALQMVHSRLLRLFNLLENGKEKELWGSQIVAVIDMMEQHELLKHFITQRGK